MKPKLTLHNILGHWKTIRTHRKWVRYYCNLAGIRWRGLKHDLSKYSPTEFFESARYWTGTGSPINEAKKNTRILARLASPSRPQFTSLGLLGR